MRYLLAIGLAFTVLSVSGCNSGLGKGHQKRAASPQTTSQQNGKEVQTMSSGMGKGHQQLRAAAAQSVDCTVASLNAADGSFLCRTKQQSMKFTLTSTSQVMSGSTAANIGALHAGQHVRVEYLPNNAANRVTILP
jgi:hypothetical protein